MIPARGGSKGLPGKNARPFLGVSLLERAISIARETCDGLIVTTDSPDLARLAGWPQVDVDVRMRPAELATDEAPMLPVVQDAIRGRAGDVIVLLQPTQPLRTAAHVVAALAMLPGHDSVVSVRLIPEAYWPDRVLHRRGGLLVPATPEGRLNPRRQDARRGFVRCGTVYATRRSMVEAGSLYGDNCAPLILDGDALSIDTEEDFLRLEALARRGIMEESLAE